MCAKRYIVLLSFLVFFSAGNGIAQQTKSTTKKDPNDRILDLKIKFACDGVKRLVPLTKSPAAVKITVIDQRNGTEQTLKSDGTPIKLKLELYHTYILTAEYPKYVCKPIFINTEVKGKEDFAKLYYTLEFFLNFYRADKIASEEIASYQKPGEQICYTVSESGNGFGIQSIVKENPINLGLENDQMRKIAGYILKNLNGNTQPLVNTKIVLINDKGETVEMVITNKFGGFVFTKLPPDNNFLIQLAEDDPSLANVKIIITDKNGKTIQETMCGVNGRFKFRFLPNDTTMTLKNIQVPDSSLNLDLTGKFSGKLFRENASQPLSNTTITLLDKNKHVVTTTTTDATGVFSFKKLKYLEHYQISCPNTKQDSADIILADIGGTPLFQTPAAPNQEAVNIPLSLTAVQKIKSVYLNDPWLEIGKSKEKQVSISEKIYFLVNDFKITAEGKVILDKVLKVMMLNPNIKIEIGGHTDSKGDDAANMELSKKRAQSAVDYLVSNGISTVRLSSVGLGETKIINRCVNGIDCSEDEHSENRRLEFIVKE